MAKALQELMRIERHSYDAMIRRLEHVTGGHSTDIKLLVDLQNSLRLATDQLGLDVDDTSPIEFYGALRSQLMHDDEVFRLRLGLHSAKSDIRAVGIIADRIEQLYQGAETLQIKRAALKRVLQAVPPNRTMKRLGFRSIESVLRREDPAVIYSLGCLIESKTWHNQLDARIKRITNNDLETAALRIITIPEEWIDKLNLSEVHVASALEARPEVGAILVTPALSFGRPGSALLCAAVLLRAYQNCLNESLSNKYQSLHSGMGGAIEGISMRRTANLPDIYGLRLNWSVAYRVFSADHGDETFEDGVLFGDMKWQSVGAGLQQLCPDVNFWRDKEYVGILADDQPVSCNVIDVAANAVLNKHFSSRIYSHFNEELRNELAYRYLTHPRLSSELMGYMVDA